MRRFSLVVLAWVAIAFVPFTSAQAQEPDSRAEEAHRQREAKSRALSPPQAGRLERALIDLERGRLFERILNPPEGIYPRIGQITTGSGLSLGPGYRHAGLFGGRAALSTFAAASFSKYWMIDARLQFPRLAAGRAAAEVRAQRYDFPEEEFFGLGPDSERANFVTYGLANTVFGVSGSYRPLRTLTFSGAVDHLSPAIRAGSEPGQILRVFAPAAAPGVLDQPQFFAYEGSVDFNTRQPQGNPRSGARYAIAYQRYADLDDNRYSFNRMEVDLQQYVPLVRDRRVLALHGLVSFSDADAGADVPFYLQRTLGGPDDLRGFRRFRFRDRNLVLLQAEYRWEIFTAVDGAIFYDAGKVAPRAEDLTLREFETDYGIGFRFGTINGIFLRIEGAFGSSGGKHFVLRFGHVF